MPDLPWTPDHDVWPITQSLVEAHAEGRAVRLRWLDGKENLFAARLLRENSPDPKTIHPKSREMLVLPDALPNEILVADAAIDPDGALTVRFMPEGFESRFHPGWLRAHAWFEGEAPETSIAPKLWQGADLNGPPSFDGPKALEDNSVFLEWLSALRDYGVARLEGLPQEDGLLEKIVRRIGPVRESNFGFMYTLEIKDDPDSNAYTSDMLPQHIDMPTRETPHGLQFLYCRENTAKGGEGIYCDAYRIAEDMRLEEPEHFASLTEVSWTYNNRARKTDYRASGPIVALDHAGAITGVRYNSFLRAPLKAPWEVQERAYDAVRAFCARAQDPKYHLIFAYRPGDLLAFDNRRALHGRAGYDAVGGTRYIEGIYADRDDLYSAIRVLQRETRKGGAA